MFIRATQTKGFDSKAEHNRFVYLKSLEAHGKIKDLRCQVSFPLHVNGKLICTYIADFVYTNKKGERIVEDVKGFTTAAFRIKRKLLEACRGVSITIV